MTSIDATDDEVLRAWDLGKPVWSVSMGGLGPGCEQCIQIMAFEMWREMRDAPPKSWEQMESDADDWRAYRDAIERAPNVSTAVDALHPSGAQFGAAMKMASMFARQGHAAAMKMAPKDRHIQCSKNFPTI